MIELKIGESVVASVKVAGAVRKPEDRKLYEGTYEYKGHKFPVKISYGVVTGGDMFHIWYINEEGKPSLVGKQGRFSKKNFHASLDKLISRGVVGNPKVLKRLKKKIKL